MKLTHEQRAKRREKIKHEITIATKKGHTKAEILRTVTSKHKLSHSTILSIMRDIDDAPTNDPIGRLTIRTYKIIADLCNTSDALSTIGKKYGMSRERIRQIYAKCKLVGIPVQNRSHIKP